MTRLGPEPTGGGAPERIAAARRAIRAGVEALEAGRPGRAVLLLGHASELLVDVHLSVQERLDPAARDALTRAFREICHLIADAALLRDARAAREADLACAPLTAAVGLWPPSDHRPQRRRRT